LNQTAQLAGPARADNPGVAISVSQPVQGPSEPKGLHALAASATEDAEILERWPGGLVGVEAPFRDAQRTVACTATLVEALLASAPVGVAYLDCDLRFLRVNEKLARMNRATIAGLVGRPAAEVALAAWTQLEPACLAVLRTGDAVVDHEVVADASAGLHGDARYSIYPVTVGDEIVGLCWLVVDVSAGTRADDVCTAVTENMLEGVCAVDGDGRVTFLNAAATHMLGWTADELRGRNAHDTLHFECADGAPLSSADCRLSRVRAEGLVVHAVEETFIRRDGTMFPVTCSAAPLDHAEHGRGLVVVFRDATKERAEQLRAPHELNAVKWLGMTREALDEDRLVLYSQPIVPLAGDQPSEELLLRMIGRDGAIISPASFLPIAEEAGLIVEIDRWVIAQAARIAAQGRRLEINLSGKSIDRRLLAYIASELRASGADPTNLVFELTETAILTDVKVVEGFAKGLAELGCGLALDDFGTGFGTLTYLKLLPVQYLKIDVEFVRDLATNETNQYLVKAIVSLAHGLGQKTIAEGVEDEETLALLHQYGVDFAQGYHLGRPAPMTEASEVSS
jgi:PAS domain S-box-containing protein